MASPEQMMLESKMATSTGEEYLAIIAKLMAEKDRLITEKDELVASKDKLWREMHQMFQDQQRRYEAVRPGQTFNTGHNTNALEVQQLREENSRLKRRNKDLEQALRDALETEEESEDDEMGQGGSSSKVEAKMESSNDFELFCQSEDREPNNAFNLLSPASLDVPPNEGETFDVDSIPRTSIRITPVIKSVDPSTHTFGSTVSLAPTLLEMIVKTVNGLSSVAKFSMCSQRGYHGCVERHLASGEKTYYTIDQPGCFACKTCFNRRSICMRMVGNNQWIVLPLPPSVRDPRAKWQEEAYFIYQNQGISTRFPGVWELEDRPDRRKKQ